MSPNMDNIAACQQRAQARTWAISKAAPKTKSVTEVKAGFGVDLVLEVGADPMLSDNYG